MKIECEAWRFFQILNQYKLRKNQNKRRLKAKSIIKMSKHLVIFLILAALVGVSYSKIDYQLEPFQAKLKAAKFITQIEIYESPCQSSNITVYHLQIIVRLDDLVWAVISFGSDKLERMVRPTKQELIYRRLNNKQIKFQKVKVDAKKLANFIKYHQKDEYCVVIWNCRHYSNTLWDAIVKK